MQIISAYIMAAAATGTQEVNLLTDQQLNLDNWSNANVYNDSVINDYADGVNNLTIENVFTPASHVGPDGNTYEYYYEILWNVSASITMQYYVWSHKKLCGYLQGNGGMGYVIFEDATNPQGYSNVSNATQNQNYVCNLYRNGSLVTQAGAVPASGVTSTDVEFASANLSECMTWLQKPEHNYPRKYLQVSVEAGKTYDFRMMLSSPTGFETDEAYAGYNAEWIAVTNDAPTDNDTLKEYDGTFAELNPYASVAFVEYAVQFEATAATHYLVIDFGQINEDTEYQIEIKSLGLYEVE